MTLRNAFEELATETTLRKLVKAVTFARDLNQRLRVVVDSGSISVTGGPYLNGSTTAGTYRSWYDVSATFSVEQREIERQASLQRGMISRQKWTYS